MPDLRRQIDLIRGEVDRLQSAIDECGGDDFVRDLLATKRGVLTTLKNVFVMAPYLAEAE